MFDDAETLINRPLPPRPKLGWSAWEATAGYIALQYSPDTALRITVTSRDGTLSWAANLVWQVHEEKVDEAVTLAQALQNLWREVDRNHVIFKSLEAAMRRPANYTDDQWLDTGTQEVLDRLLNVTQRVFQDDWSVIVIYQPVEMQAMRLQARLLARQNSIQKAGRGPTLRDACRNLYNYSSGVFAMEAKRLNDSS